MKSKIIPILIANMFAASVAVAADGDFAFSGSLGLGLKITKEKAADNAKLNEYRDLSGSGPVLDNFDLNGGGSNSTYYSNMFGENIGRDDQYFNLQGGNYGIFKYQLYDNKIIHNLTSNALSPFGPIGSNILNGPKTPSNAATNPATFASFNEYMQRENIGGNLEVTNNSPWFFRVDAKRLSTTGVKPLAFSAGGTLEVPSPVSWKTNDISIEGGYASKRGQLSVSVLRSNFSDGVPGDLLKVNNPSIGTGVNQGTGFDALTLPPDSTMTKWATNGVLKQLPMGSTLSARINYQKLENSFAVAGVPGLATQLVNNAGIPVQAGTASAANFNGNIQTKSAAFSLTSNPSRQVDTRAYWNWYQRNNSSTQVSYTTGIANTPSVADYYTQLNYKKNNVGLEGAYRLNPTNKVSGGLDYLSTDRLRDDADNVKNRKIFAEYKNTALDMLGGRIRYQFMQQRANRIATNADSVLENQYFYKFDSADVDQHLVKLVLDSSPIQQLDLGLEVIYKQNNYKNPAFSLGRTKDTREEYNLTASYGDPTRFRITAFADLEYVRYSTDHRYAPRTGTINTDPSVPLFVQPGVCYSTCSYNWSDTNKDQNYAIGIGADWPATAQLSFTGSYIYERTQGLAEFTSVNNVGTPSNIAGANIANFDNTTKHSLNLKALYKYSKNLNLTGGWAYERFGYNDDAVQAYAYTAGGNGSYYGGAWAFPSYTAQIYYLMGTYNFN